MNNISAATGATWQLTSLPERQAAQCAQMYLNLSKVSLLLAEANLANLRVSQDADDCGLLPELVKVCLNALAAISILLGIVAEGLSLALVPVQSPLA